MMRHAIVNGTFIAICIINTAAAAIAIWGMM